MLSDSAYAKDQRIVVFGFIFFFLFSQKHRKLLENNQKLCTLCPVAGVPREQHSRDLTYKIYLEKTAVLDLQSIFLISFFTVFFSFLFFLSFFFSS